MTWLMTTTSADPSDTSAVNRPPSATRRPRPLATAAATGSGSMPCTSQPRSCRSARMAPCPQPTSSRRPPADAGNVHGAEIRIRPPPGMQAEQPAAHPARALVGRVAVPGRQIAALGGLVQPAHEAVAAVFGPGVRVVGGVEPPDVRLGHQRILPDQAARAAAPVAPLAGRAEHAIAEPLVQHGAVRAAHRTVDRRMGGDGCGHARCSRGLTSQALTNATGRKITHR